MPAKRPLPSDLALRWVREYLDHRSASGDLDKSVLETGLFLEDALGVSLDDNDLTPDCLGTEDALLRLVEAKLRGNV